MLAIEVKDKKTRHQFLDLPKKLYKGDNNWTCILDSEIEGIFDPKQNSCFADGDACRWVLLDSNNKVIGRIAAFYDNKKVNNPHHG